MLVTVNADLCCGHALCVDVAPDVFEMRDDGKAYVLSANPDESLKTQVEDAVKICPQMAIDCYADDSGGPSYR